MTYYRFDVVDGSTFEVGEYDCADQQQAEAIAQGVAERMVRTYPELVGEGYALAVRSPDDAEEIYRVSFDAVNKTFAN